MNRSSWTTFTVLCVLSGSAWIADQNEVSTLPSLEKQALLFAVIGLIALALSGRRIGSRNHWRSSLGFALASILFFGVPALAIELAKGAIPAVSRAALFALVPIVIIVTLSAGSATEADERGAGSLLIPALVGLAGLLLLLPLDFSSTPRGITMLSVLVVAIVAVGISNVWLFRNLKSFTSADQAVLACLPTAIFLLICNSFMSGFDWRPSDLMSLASIPSLIFVTEVVLLLWLLRAMPPVQFSARYLLIPLLSVVEGYILLRPELTFRIAVGAVLLAFGTAALLLLRPSGEDEMLSLR